MNRQNANFQIKNLVTTAMLMAIGLILPFFTGQIPQIGSMLLPMHIPVFICGFVCGWPYGGVMGFFLPLVRHVAFGMPPVLSAVAMAFELAAYGMICGFLYNRSHWKCIVALYRSLIAAMIGGRIVWGLVYALIAGVAKEAFTWEMFLAGAFLGAIPGIVVQLIFIPSLMVALNRTGILRLYQEPKRDRT